MKAKKGGNVQRGAYCDTGDSGDVRSGNGRFGDPRKFIDDHRMNTGVPAIKGHHFKGARSRKTGKTFG